MWGYPLCLPLILIDCRSLYSTLSLCSLDGSRCKAKIISWSKICRFSIMEMDKVRQGGIHIYVLHVCFRVGGPPIVLSTCRILQQAKESHGKKMYYAWGASIKDVRGRGRGEGQPKLGKVKTLL